MGVSESIYYRWKKKVDGLGGAEVHRLRDLQDENKRSKDMVADLILDKQFRQGVL